MLTAVFNYTIFNSPFLPFFCYLIDINIRMLYHEVKVTMMTNFLKYTKPLDSIHGVF